MLCVCVLDWDGQEFLQAIEKRRVQFKELGCVATDHGLPDAFTYESSLQKMSAIFNTAYRRKGRGITSSDAKAFRGVPGPAPAQASSLFVFFLRRPLTLCFVLQ